MARQIVTRKHRPAFILIALCLFVIFITGCGGIKSGVINNDDYADSSNPFITPTGLTAVEYTAGTYTVDWDDVPGAAYYIVVSAGKIVVPFKATESYYENTGIDVTDQPYFIVKACTNTICGWESGEFIAVFVPRNLKGQTETTSIALSWDGSLNTNRYFLYLNCGLASETEIELDFNSYMHTDLTPDTEYRYCVKSCYNDLCTDRSEPLITRTTAPPP